MTRTEHRWMIDIVSAFAPEGGPGLAPSAGEADYGGTFRRMGQEATRKAALGLRLAVLVVAFAPPLCGLGLRLFSQLRPRERTALLGRLLSHRLFALRELTLLLKFVAAVALLGSESARERSGYDRVSAPQRNESDSGVRHRLPVFPKPLSHPADRQPSEPPQELA